MRYQILQPFTVKTPQKTLELQAGQVITLPEDKAIKLITAGKIIPIERIAYKIYSELLDCFLWVVADDKDMETLRDNGITEPIYTEHDITEIKKLPKEALKEIHKVKKVFPESKVNQINQLTLQRS